MLIWLILIPVLAAAAIGLLKAPGRATALVSATLTFLLGLGAILAYSGCIDCCCCGAECSQFTLQPVFARVMLLLTLIVTLGAVVGLKAPNPQAERSWAVSTLLISAGATGAFLSDNIISFYAFHELALIPTFVMIGYYGRGDRRSISWTMVIYLGVASMVLLVGLLMLCLSFGAFTFSGLAANVAAGGGNYSYVGAIAGLLLAGFGTLVSLFPFHSWAAPAYASAPTPVAMLHAGVLKKFGLYGLFMVADCFGSHCGEVFGSWNNLLLLFLLGNILWVGYVTVSQTRLDDMLGNSSVMHMGYIFLAFAAYIAANGTNQLAVLGAEALIFGHGLTIALLFLLCGQVEDQTRTLEMDSLGGLAKRLPTLGFLFGLAGLASIGLPLLANFVGEFTIFASCFNGTSLGDGLMNIGPVQVATFFALWGLVISAVYMLRAFRRVFEGEESDAAKRAVALGSGDVLAAAFLAFFIVLFGCIPVTSLF